MAKRKREIQMKFRVDENEYDTIHPCAGDTRLQDRSLQSIHASVSTVPTFPGTSVSGSMPLFHPLSQHNPSSIRVSHTD